VLYKIKQLGHIILKKGKLKPSAKASVLG